MALRRLERSLRVTFLGMTLNALLSAGKMAAGVAGHSNALIADGIESLADVISSVVVWRGVVVAAAPADADHPYGHGKAEPLAAAVVSIFLFLAAIWIVIEASHEIMTPHLTPAPFTLIVLIVVVLIKETLFRYAHSEATVLDSSAVKGDAWHHRSDAITSLLAGIGITIALIGGKGYEAADDYAAILAAGIIAWNGWKMLKPAMDELMDASAPAQMYEEIQRIASGHKEVFKVERCVARKMGYDYFVDMHIEVAPTMTVFDAHRVAHEVKDAIRKELPRVRDVLVHIEPAG